jgi:hypothetical protein
MAILNFTGFEGQATSLGSTPTGTYSFATTPVYQGGRSFRTNPSTTNVGYGFLNVYTNTGDLGSFISAYTTKPYYSMRFRYGTKPASNSEEILMFMGIIGPTTPTATVRIDSSGFLSVYQSGGTTLVATGATALAQDTWYEISGFFDATTGDYELYIDGVLELSGNATFGTALNFAFGKVANRNGNSVNYYYDNVILADAPIATDLKVAIALANADGSTQQFSAGTGASNYTQIDEVPHSSADYVMNPGGGTNELALFRFQSVSDLGITGKSIVGLIARYSLREDTSQATSLILTCKSGATTSTKANHTALGTAVRKMAFVIDNDPNTGSRFSDASFDAVEFGVQETTSFQIRIEGLYLEVLYSDSVILPAEYKVMSESDDLELPASYGVIPPNNMFVTDWKKPNAVLTDDSIGTDTWVEPEHILDGDAGSAFAGYVYVLDKEPRLSYVQLYIDGEITAGNRGDDNTGIIDFGIVDWDFGHQIDKFGNSITTEQANDEYFGAAIAINYRDPADDSLVSVTNYLVGRDYRFNIPSNNSTIIGVEVRVSSSTEYAGPGVDTQEIYDLQMRVHYYLELIFDSRNEAHAIARFNEEVYKESDFAKSYQYLVSNKGQFVGEWQDVMTEPQVTLELNALPGNLQLELARTIENKPLITEPIEVEGYVEGELMHDNYDQEIYAVKEDQLSLGDGTDLEVNYDVLVNEYYGSFEALVDQNGEEILTPELDYIAIPVGFPNGRPFFRGYVSTFGIRYSGAQSSVQVRLLHDSDEFNNEMYRTSDEVELTAYDEDSEDAQVFYNGLKFLYDPIAVAQTFTTGGAFVLGSVKAKMGGWIGNEITVKLKTGATPGSGTVLGTAKAYIPGSGPQKLSFSFADPISLSGSTAYHLEFTGLYEKYTSSQSAPAYMYFGVAMANGSAYKQNDDTTWTNLSGSDYSIEILSFGGDTKVTHNSQDPSDILKAVLDYNSEQGGRMGYLTTGIETTGSVVSASFNANSIKEALDYILKLSPADWYYYIAPGNLNVEYRLKPTTVSHTFRLGINIVEVEISKTIESMVNKGYFTGGGSPALFVVEQDSDSINDYRKGMKKLSDTRVTDEDSARILVGSELDAYKNPLFAGRVRILRDKHPQLVQPGELVQMSGFGNFIDDLQLQVMRVVISPTFYDVELGMLLPRVSKRVEDIKRNLNLVETQNNPDAPS